MITRWEDETGKGEQRGYANDDQHKCKIWVEPKDFEQGTEFSANG